MRCYLVNVLALLALALMSSLVLVASEMYSRCLGTLCLGFLFLICASKSAVASGVKTVFGLCGLGLALYVSRMRSYEALLALSAGFGLLEIARLASERKRKQGDEESWFAFQVASLALALFLFLRANTNAVLRVTDAFVGLTTFWGGRVGFWVSASPLYLFGIVVILTLALIQHSPGLITKSAFLGVSAIAAKHLLLALSPITATKVSLFQVACVAWIGLMITSSQQASVVPSSQALKRRRMKIIVISLIFASVAAISFQEGYISRCFRSLPPTKVTAEAQRKISSSGFSDKKASRSNIILYSPGLLNWEVPSMERIGLISSGMFGSFRDILDHLARSRSGNLTLADSLSCEILKGAALVVFINPTRALSHHEVGTLEGFVREGGGMLVLGDHTNIGGSKAALDSILSFSKIRFNFDSAVSLRKYWRGCLEIRRHGVTEGMRDEVDVQLATGASLRISRPAEALVLGKYGFSDWGDPTNAGFKAFMGNVTHESHEQLGDLVLVASQTIGKGRLLVFGDTSPFQNVSLALTWRLVRNSIVWLEGWERATLRRAEPLTNAHEIAIIDFSLRPRASLELFNPNSLGGLANSLARFGIEARIARSGEEWLPDAAFIFLVSPGRNLRSRLDDLKGYMRRGGHVIIAQGREYRGPSQAILKAFGFEVGLAPLGGGDNHDVIEHKEAWPIEVSDGCDTLTFACAFGYPTVVTRRIGQGSLTLIADAKLLLDDNLESERTGNPHNIAFLGHLLDGIRGGCGGFSKK